MTGSTATIILVEPHDDSRWRYETALRDAGFDVRAVAECGAAALMLSSFVPSLLIASFDERTHDDCIALCLHVKTDPRTRAVPIILASPSVDEGDVRRATDISVLAVAVPPNDGTKLASAVKGVLAARPTAA